jgi:hypothetical protein
VTPYTSLVDEKKGLMHTRAMAHVRAAEKYLYGQNTRKAIAHFGRAMHYFGANCSNAGVAKETDEVLGFLITFLGFDGKYTKAAYFLEELHVRERVTRGMIARHDDFVIPKPPPALWEPSDKYVDSLKRYHREEARRGILEATLDDGPVTPSVAFTDGKFKGCSISHTLFITKHFADSVAFLIPGSAERGHMFFNLCGISDNTGYSETGHTSYNTYSPSLITFLNDAEQMIYNVTRAPYELIEFHKHRGEYDPTAGRVSLCKITALLVLPKADAMTKVERVIGAINSVNEQFEAALVICHNNERDKSDRAAYRAKFRAWCEDPSAKGSNVEITTEYIMTVLRRVLPRGNQQFRKERVSVECVAKRKFARTDLKIRFLPSQLSAYIDTPKPDERTSVEAG